MKIRMLIIIISCFGLFFISIKCGSIGKIDKSLSSPEKFIKSNDTSQYIKIHMNSGELFIAKSWSTIDSAGLFKVDGKHYSYNRELIHAGSFVVKKSEIAVIESNQIINQLAGYIVFTGASLALTTYCIVNPKACFGSCPTFYAWNGEKEMIMAESFSESVAPYLEARDIDALFGAVPNSEKFSLRLTNEALETHVIKKADLIIVKKPDRGRVLITSDNSFLSCVNIISPYSFNVIGNNNISNNEKDDIDKILNFDESEYYDETDSANLITKEYVEFEFNVNSINDKALILGFRQSFVTTYLFYQGLAYLGTTVSDFMAKESASGKLSGLKKNFSRYLGGIEVEYKKNDEWISIGNVNEYGPIAHNIHAIKLNAKIPIGNNKFRLKISKGLWRINYIALADCNPTYEINILKPDSVTLKNQFCKEITRSLKNNVEPLVNLPGAEYLVHYTLPKDFTNYELFLDAQGYYLEWMRKEWIQEENLLKAYEMFFDTEKFLKKIAPEFKCYEKIIENDFWNSKYVNNKN